MATGRNRSTVFLEFSRKVNGRVLLVGRTHFELYDDLVPKAARNFRELCTGRQGTAPNGVRLHYKGTSIYRVIPRFTVQGGDIQFDNGTGGSSIYGPVFEDENLNLRHSKRGILSLARQGPNSNGSQFFITLDRLEWLNGAHTVVGEMVEGSDTLRKIENLGSINGIPRDPIFISDCGIVS